MFSKVIILAFAALAIAGPNMPRAEGNGNARDSCGANSTVHCCNNETAEKLVSKDSLNLEVADLQNLLGQCNDVTVAVLGGAVPLKNMCKQSAVCCGDMTQSGLVNVGCTPLQLV